MNRTFRVLLRSVVDDGYGRGKGVILKKRIYTSEKDFLKYKDETIKRYISQGTAVCEELKEDLRDFIWVVVERYEHQCGNYCLVKGHRN